MSLQVKVVRKFDLSLLNEYADLEFEAFKEGGFNEWVLPIFIRYGKTFALIQDGEHIGLAHFIRCFDNFDNCFLAGFSIKEDHRHRGLGGYFLGKCIEKLKKSHLKAIFLTTANDNYPAIKMYERFEFVKVKELKDEYGKNIDRLLLKKVIT